MTRPRPAPTASSPWTTPAITSPIPTPSSKPGRSTRVWPSPPAPVRSSRATPTARRLLYASNFRSGKIDVYDSNFHTVTLPAGAFTDPNLPKGYAPFNVQVLNGQGLRHLCQAGRHQARRRGRAGHGFVDVFNLDGTPGLAGGQVRLISRGPLDSPWGLAIAPTGFAGSVPRTTTPCCWWATSATAASTPSTPRPASFLGQLKDPDGEPIQIDGLWALKVGNGGTGGDANTVYFTAGLFGETHGLFGSLTTAAPGTPEGPAEAQLVQADLDVVQLDLATPSINDITSGAPEATLRQDIKILDAARAQFAHDEIHFSADTRHEL